MNVRRGGLDPRRAAEVIVTLADGNLRRGSGYLVAQGLVLTAAHVVDGAVAVRVRFDAEQSGQWSAPTRTAWTDADVDIAVLRVLEATADPPGAVLTVAGVSFGRIVWPPVECETLGFPRFKMREDPPHPGADGEPARYRDCEHATGPATTWANRKEGTLQIRVGAPERGPDPARSPWEGMSGAPVFSGDVLVGVIGRHHGSDGPGTLAAYRIDHWHERLSAGRIDELVSLIGLPARREELMQVTAATRPATGGALHQLPATTPTFTGRERELAELLALADEAGDAPGTVVISAIDGMAGVGKTTLAVHAGYRLAERFPDGQLFIDLHGHTRGLAPRDPADALAAILQALEVSPGQIPADLEACAAFYRNRLAGTRTLIILDNALNEAQVRPLLPGDGGCLVMVTSRRRLKALDDARALPLDVLPMADAVALFREVAGSDQAPAGDPLLEEIVVLCGRLPLALRIAAALIRNRHSWTLAYLAEKLRKFRPSLERFSDGDRDLTSVFDLSYRTLGSDQQLLFRRLGVHPGTDVDAYAAAALLHFDLDDAEDLLQDLVDHNLLAEPAAGRYRMHDLIRAHAQTLAAGDSVRQRDIAVARLLDYYQYTALSADTRTFRYARHRPSGPPPAHAPTLRNPDEARAWLRAERANLESCLRLAADHGLREQVVALTEGMAELLYADGPWSQAQVLHTAAAAEAERLGDLRSQADALNNLGRVLHMTGNYRSAIDALARAGGVFDRLSEPAGQADALNELGRVLHTTGEYAEAFDAHTRALALYRGLEDVAGQADAMSYRATIRRLTKDFAGAADDLALALALYERSGNRLGQAKSFAFLGHIRQLIGDAADDDAFARATTLYQELGNDQSEPVRPGASDDGQPPRTGPGKRIDQAGALLGLARMRTIAQDYQGALEAQARALEIYREERSYDNEAWATNLHAAVFAAAGDVEQALAVYRRALRLTREVQHRDDEAIALEGIGECLARTGAPQHAAEHLRQALAAYRSLTMRPDIERVEARLRALEAS